MEKDVPLFESLKTIFYFIFFELENALFGVNQL
jgi:hypothetical protein